jgi:hypothetical protein
VVPRVDRPPRRLTDGRVKCWGHHYLGFSGIYVGDDPGEMGDALPSVDLGTRLFADDIKSGHAGTCVLLKGGGVKCGGNNSEGQLGLGDTVDRGHTDASMEGRRLQQMKGGQPLWARARSESRRCPRRRGRRPCRRGSRRCSRPTSTARREASRRRDRAARRADDLDWQHDVRGRQRGEVDQSQSAGRSSSRCSVTGSSQLVPSPVGAGRSTTNRVPTPGRLVAPIVPPRSAARRRHSVSPRPVPP